MADRRQLQIILGNKNDGQYQSKLRARVLLEMWDKNPELRPEGHVYTHGFYPPQLIADPDPDQLPEKCKVLFLFTKNISNSYSPRFRNEILQLPDISDEIDDLPINTVTILLGAITLISLIYWNYYGHINAFRSPKLPISLHNAWIECCRKLHRIPSYTIDTLTIDNILLIRSDEEFSRKNIRQRFSFFNADEFGSSSETTFLGYSFAALRYACHGIVDIALNLQLAMHNHDKEGIITNLNQLIVMADQASNALSEVKLNPYAEIAIIPSHWSILGQVGPIPPEQLLSPKSKKTVEVLTEENLNWNTATDESLNNLANENKLYGTTASGLFDPIFATFDIIIDRSHTSELGKMFISTQRLLPKAYLQFLEAFRSDFKKTGSLRQYLETFGDSELAKTFNLLERSYHRFLNMHRSKALGLLSFATQMDRNMTVANRETKSENAYKEISADLDAGINDRQFISRLYPATIQSTPANLNQRKNLQYVMLFIGSKTFSYREGDKIGVLIPNTATNYRSISQNFTLNIHTKDPVESQWILFLRQYFGIVDGKLSKEIFIKYADFSNSNIKSSPSEIPPKVPRVYSIASFDNDNIKILVERIDNGEVSPILAPQNNLFNKDQIVNIFPVSSSFQLPQDTSKPIVMIGIGSGVAPYQSFIDRNKKMDEGRNMFLYFGCRTKEGAPDKIDYTKLCLSADNRQNLKESEYIYNGRITSYLSSTEGQNKLRELCSQGAFIYICGPTTLYRDMITVLKSAIGIKQLLTMLTDRIRVEVYRPILNDGRRKISVYDVITHNGGSNGSWMVIDDCVYDVGQYIDLHPGGNEIIESVLGTDATALFNLFPTLHGKMARSILQLYYIGDVEKLGNDFERLAYDVTRKQNSIAAWYGDNHEKQYFFVMKNLDAHVACQHYFNDVKKSLVGDGRVNKELPALQVIHEYNELVQDEKFVFPYLRNTAGDLVTEDDEWKIMQTLYEYKSIVKQLDIFYLDRLKRVLVKDLCCITSEN